MNGIRIIHQDVLKLSDAQGLASLVSFFKNKASFREHGYKCGDMYVMPPFNGEYVVLCVHGQVPFLEVYAKKGDVTGHLPIRLTDLIEVSVESVDSCTFELKKVGGKRWRLRAENSLKKDEWIQNIKKVQQSCASELCLEELESGGPSTVRSHRLSVGSAGNQRLSQSLSEGSNDNIYTPYPVNPSKAQPILRSNSHLNPSTLNQNDSWPSPRSLTSLSSLPPSSPKPRTRRTILDMPILAPDHLNAISPPRALSCPQSPQSPAPTLTLRHQTPIALQNRFESARSKKFVLGMPIPLPSLSEQNGQDVDMVETSNEFKLNRNSNSSNSNRESVSSGSNQENERTADFKGDIYGYYGMLKINENEEIYDNHVFESPKTKLVSLVVPICAEGLKLVKAMDKTWIVGWKPKFQRALGGVLHFGDELVAINGKTINNSMNIVNLFHGTRAGLPVRLTINPSPYGHTFVLRKPNRGNLPLGITLYKEKNRVESVSEGSIASMASFPAMLPSFSNPGQTVQSVITEVEDIPLDMFSKNKEPLQKIDSIPSGHSFSVVVHPRDFVKLLKAQLKTNY